MVTSITKTSFFRQGKLHLSESVKAPFTVEGNRCFQYQTSGFSQIKWTLSLWRFPKESRVTTSHRAAGVEKGEYAFHATARTDRIKVVISHAFTFPPAIPARFLHIQLVTFPERKNCG